MAIHAKDLIAQFQTMHREKWRYEANAAERGCVDCSGAFVYAYRQFGKIIAHGSNTIARKYIIELLPISMAEPGMAAFKCRPWAEDQKSNRWFMTDPGDIHHIGLVDEDVRYVLNAKGKDYGFCRDKLTEKAGWDYVARLSDVEYSGGGEPMQVYISGGNPDAPIRMRERATTQSKIVTEIPQNSQAEKTGEEKDWSKITYAGMTGYVMSIFVHESQPPIPTDNVQVPLAELLQVRELIDKWIGSKG